MEKARNPIQKKNYSKGKAYLYCYIQHTALQTYKRSWYYIGKEIPKEYQELVHRKNLNIIHNNNVDYAKFRKLYTKQKSTKNP